MATMITLLLVAVVLLCNVLAQQPNAIDNHIMIIIVICLFLARQPPPLPQWARASSFTRFLDHTQRRNTFCRTPLDELSASRGDLYLTTHNTRNRQASMPPAGIRTHNLTRRAAVDLRLRPRGHWDRQFVLLNSELIYALIHKL